MPVSGGGSYVPAYSYSRVGATDTGGTYVGPSISGGTQTSLHVVTAYPADGAITIATGVARLTKGSAGAYTLAAPTAAQEGTQIIITAGTAFAHVVTATGLLQDGITGGAKNTVTMGAFVGASITLEAINLFWYVISKNIATVA